MLAIEYQYNAVLGIHFIRHSSNCTIIVVSGWSGSIIKLDVMQDQDSPLVKLYSLLYLVS